MRCTWKGTWSGSMSGNSRRHGKGDRPSCFVRRASRVLRRPSEDRSTRHEARSTITMTFGTIEQAIDDLRNGKIIVVADDQDRENEGDLVCAAELVTPEMVNFMATHGRGLICLALTSERCDQLGLPPMAEQNTEALSTAFTVSIDADKRFGVGTGISASDRAT